MKRHIPLIALLAVLLISCQTKFIEKEASLGSEFYAINTPKVDITYAKVEETELKLDLYLVSEKLGENPWIQYSQEKHPTLIFIHGGGWASGNKSTSVFEVLPYIKRGWNVVNINYRLISGGTSVLDCVSDVNKALEWVVANSDTYNFDTNRIVTAGDSAGGHLALMLGIANTSNTKIAGVVNWYGITDMDKVITFWNNDSYTKSLIGDMDKFDEICKEISPINFVTKNTPPILTIHGTADQVVPYEQGKTLHNKLEALGLPNQLLTLKSKKHGNFNVEEMTLITKTTFDFLKKHGVE